MTLQDTCAKYGIDFYRVEFDGPGTYYVTSPANGTLQAELSLGENATEQELAESLRDVCDQGGDFTDWTVSKGMSPDD